MLQIFSNNVIKAKLAAYLVLGSQFFRKLEMQGFLIYWYKRWKPPICGEKTWFWFHYYCHLPLSQVIFHILILH